MIGCNLFQMHVYDLAPLKVLVIEVTQDEFALGNIGQELFLCYLCVLTVTLDDVLLLLLIVTLHLGHSSLAEVPHHLVLFDVQHVIIFLILVLLVLMEELALVICIV
jgi:hypothetical protein